MKLSEAAGPSETARLIEASVRGQAKAAPCCSRSANNSRRVEGGSWHQRAARSWPTVRTTRACDMRPKAKFEFTFTSNKSAGGAAIRRSHPLRPTGMVALARICGKLQKCIIRSDSPIERIDHPRTEGNEHACV